jgi:hypothetical protein
MKTDFEVGDRVRRTEGDTEIGIIEVIHGDDALVDFNRVDRILQRIIKLNDLEVLPESG